MGCSTSKLNGSEVVRLCRNRKRTMRDAIKYQQQFSSAHLAYIGILPEVGHALSHYADRQVSDLVEVKPDLPAPASGSAAVPPSKPPQVIYRKLPPSSSDMPTKPLPVPDSSLLDQEGPAHSNPDTNATKGDPSSHPAALGNSETLFFDDDFPPSIQPSVQEDSDDVLMSSVPSSPSGVPSYYASLQPSSLHDSEWDPFNLFEATHFRSPKQASEYWDTESGAYDFVGIEGLPDLEEVEVPRMEHIEPSNISAEPGFSEVSETESSLKPGKKQKEANSGKALERIDEDPAELDEGPPADTKSDGAPQEAKDLNTTVIARVKHVNECMEKIKDTFAKASEIGREVSQILETQILHQRPWLRDFRDSFRFSHSRRQRSLSRSISREMSLGLLDDELNFDSHGSLALTLERLYRWEKKLYKEVKVGDQLQIAFSRKSREFFIVEGRGKDPDLIQQCRAEMKSLESQLTVAFKAISSASLRIQQVTTAELYPQLIELLERLKTMWKSMLECHQTQADVAVEILTINKSGLTFAASEAHQRAAAELENQLEMWQQCFYFWVESQQRYVKTLLAWIRICHMESGPTVKMGSASHALTSGEAPIYLLTRNWHNSLQHLGNNMGAVDAIEKFAGVVHDVQLREAGELAEMKRAEKASISMDRRSHERVTSREQTSKDMVVTDERRQEEAVLAGLQQHLPSIFEAFNKFSSVAWNEYEKLLQGVEASSKK